MQEHADPRYSGGARRRGSQDPGLPDPAAQRVVVQVVGWRARESDVPGPGPTDARALDTRERGNLGPETTVSDSTHLTYYFDSRISPNTCLVSLSKLDLKPGAPVKKLTIRNGEISAPEYLGLALIPV